MAEKKRYDLDVRTLKFARCVRKFVKKTPRSRNNANDCQQLIRASGSVGSNYIEACDSLGAKDFRMHIKICRKESRECGYWLRLIETGSDESLEGERDSLLDESTQLMKIFGAILKKTS